MPSQAGFGPSGDLEDSSFCFLYWETDSFYNDSVSSQLSWGAQNKQLKIAWTEQVGFLISKGSPVFRGCRQAFLFVLGWTLLSLTLKTAQTMEWIFTPSECGQHANSSERWIWYQWIPGVLNGFWWLLLRILLLLCFLSINVFFKNLLLSYGVKYRDQKTA